MAVWLSHGQSIIPPSDETSWEHLGQPVLGLPAPVYVFIVVTIILAVVMRRTRFGRQIYLLGENRVAARAAALPITLLTVGAFGIASLYTAGSGILIGATSANASLLLTGSYTYDAIAAALVGGNAVTGGRGSIARTAAGAIFIATISDMLLLRGYSTGGQILVRGIIVVVVVVLTNLQGAEPMSTVETTRRRPRAGEPPRSRSWRSWSWRWRSCRWSRSTRCGRRTSTTSSRTSRRTASSPSRSGSRSSRASSTSRSPRCTSSAGWSRCSPGRARPSSASPPPSGRRSSSASSRVA